jgi:hypothetical protein
VDTRAEGGAAGARDECETRSLLLDLPSFPKITGRVFRSKLKNCKPAQGDTVSIFVLQLCPHRLRVRMHTKLKTRMKEEQKNYSNSVYVHYRLKYNIWAGVKYLLKLVHLFLLSFSMWLLE